MKQNFDFLLPKQELQDYLKDRMETRYEGSPMITRSPLNSIKSSHGRLVMSSPKNPKPSTSFIAKDPIKKSTFHIVPESEKLLGELLICKKNSNVLYEENVKFRTKILNLEKQITKYEKIVQEIERSGVFQTSLNSQQINEDVLVMTLRKRIQELNDELIEKGEDMKRFKKTTKYTNHQQLEIENKNYFQENNRLREIIVKQGQKMQQMAMHEKEMFRVIQTFDRESQNLNQLKQENESLLQNLQFYKEENSNLNGRLEKQEKENTFIEFKRKCAFLQKENLSLKSLLFSYEEQIKELNAKAHHSQTSEKSLKLLESQIREKEHKILTLENHVAEQKALMEKERQNNKELRSEIQRISALNSNNKNNKNEKTHNLEGKKSISEAKIENQEKMEKNNEKIEKKQEKIESNQEKIEKNPEKKEINDENTKENQEKIEKTHTKQEIEKIEKNSQIEISEVELAVECARANVLKAGLSLAQIKKAFKPDPELQEEDSPEKIAQILSHILSKPPFLLQNEEERHKLARFIVQRSKTHNLSEFATIFSSLLEPLQILSQGDLKELRAEFIECVTKHQERIFQFLGEEASATELQKQSLWQILGQIDGSLLDFYDFILLEFPYSTSPLSLLENLVEYVSLYEDSNQKLKTEGEPLDPEEEGELQGEDAVSKGEVSENVGEEGGDLPKKSSRFNEVRSKSEEIPKQEVEAKGEENLVRGNTVTDPQKLNSFEAGLEKLRQEQGEQDTEENNFEMEEQILDQEEGMEGGVVDNESERKRLEEELNYDFNNKRPFGTHDDFEKINESFGSEP